MFRKRFRLTPQVKNELCKTIGNHSPETGVLLGSSDGHWIDHVYFDHTARTTDSTYTPDVTTLNKKKDEWNNEGVLAVGLGHSHPDGCHMPSPQDYEFGLRIMKPLELDSFYMPIVNVSNPPDGTIKVYPYIIDRHYRLRRGWAFAAKERVKKPHAGSAELFTRIAPAIPMDAMQRKTVICIGTGGAMDFVENLARCGVGNFILIDGDKVSETNIATQQAYVSEIGRYKVHALRDRILNIHPKAKVKAVHRFLEDTMSDEQLERIVGSTLAKTPQDVLICGCTDNFHAQARSAALAMKYGTPYLAAQLYKGGMAAEIYFSYPGVTNSSCPRCAMSNRYDAYENGYKNDVTSGGTPIFATTRVNSLKGQIALMLLLYHEDENCTYSNMLDSVADRNFVMIRMNPLAGSALGIGIFDEAVRAGSGLAFFDETVWIPQIPNTEPTCPLCGGTGDLLALKGSIRDTRTD